jgi:AcrR family transcriptional regulator
MMEPLAAHSKREWILIGMVESCAARGYERTSVADVCATAGVERASFEELFEDRDGCLAAAMETALAEARERIAAGYFPAKPWAAAVRDGTGAVLALLAERPALARTALIEAPSAGGRAAELYAEGKRELQSFIERGREQATDRGVPASAGRAALAGAEALIVGQILAGRARQLGEHTGEVAYMLTVPYLGQGEALREAGRRTAFRHLRAVA